jgi:hypothetical protein
MKVKLIREASIKHAAGEIVEVSPVERDFLVSVGSALDVVDEAVESTKDTPAPKPKRTATRAKK